MSHCAELAHHSVPELNNCKLPEICFANLLQIACCNKQQFSPACAAAAAGASAMRTNFARLTNVASKIFLTL